MGALLPLIGPHFHFGYGPDNGTFDVTAARFWLQILPGLVTFAAGLFLLVGANRITGTLAAYVACAAGVWFVIGPVLADLRTPGYVGLPLGSSDRQHIDAIASFDGLGAVILFLAALAAGRMSVVGIRDYPNYPSYPATREVPVTTTQVRPSAAPAVVTLPESGTATDASVASAVADAGDR